MPPNKMDPECIWFQANNLESLPDLLYWFDGCHSGQYDWQVSVKVDCGKNGPTFLIEGPVGQRGYDGALAIASLINQSELQEEEDAAM